MRSTLLLVVAALASSVVALPGSSDYGSSEGSSYSGSSYGSSGESSYSGDNSGSSGNSWPGNSSPSYGGESYSKPSNSYESKSSNSYESKSSNSYESKSYEVKSYTKSESHETKTHSDSYGKSTKTHESYSKETKASRTHSYLVGTHASKSHASYSKETHSYKAYSSKSKDCTTHAMTYTQTETGESGGYTTNIIISFSTETFGAGTTAEISQPYTTPLALTQTYFTFTSTSSVAQATSTLLTQQNSTTTAPLTFKGAATRSTDIQAYSIIAATMLGMVMLCL